ncbi:VanZ family protein [Boseongicola aestuarii]|nr:VanZ family protein [Boseongicola aestuarii]
MTASKRHALALLSTIILASVIAYLTLTPPRLEASYDLLSDKAYHVIAFAALIFPGALLYLRSLIWLIPAALVFGAAIELVQPLVGRSAEMADFAADIIGVACGLILGLTMRRWWFQPRRGHKPRAAPVKASR